MHTTRIVWIVAVSALMSSGCKEKVPTSETPNKTIGTVDRKGEIWVLMGFSRPLCLLNETKYHKKGIKLSIDPSTIQRGKQDERRICLNFDTSTIKRVPNWQVRTVRKRNNTWVLSGRGMPLCLPDPDDVKYHMEGLQITIDASTIIPLKPNERRLCLDFDTSTLKMPLTTPMAPSGR